MGLPGNIFMDTPTFDQLERLAKDRDKWKIRVSKMRARARGTDWIASNKHVKEMRQEAKSSPATAKCTSIYRYHLELPDSDKATTAPPPTATTNTQLTGPKQTDIRDHFPAKFNPDILQYFAPHRQQQPNHGTSNCSSASLATTATPTATLAVRRRGTAPRTQQVPQQPHSNRTAIAPQSRSNHTALLHSASRRSLPRDQYGMTM